MQSSKFDSDNKFCGVLQVKCVTIVHATTLHNNMHRTLIVIQYLKPQNQSKTQSFASICVFQPQIFTKIHFHIVLAKKKYRFDFDRYSKVNQRNNHL